MDNSGLVFVFAGFPLMRYMIMSLLKKSKVNKSEFALSKFKNDEQLHQYLTDLIDFIENSDIIEKKMVLDMVLSKHKSHCSQSLNICPCSSI